LGSINNKIKNIIKKIDFKKIDYKNPRLIALVGGVAAIISLTVYSSISDINAARLDAKFAQVEVMEIVAEVEEEGILTVVTETKEVEIPFTRSVRASTDLNAGEERIAQNGQNGKRLETYEITYLDGVMQSKVLVDNKTITKAIAQITETGGASVTLASRGDDARYSKVMTMTATGYCICKTCTGSGNGITATGRQAKKGVVAVDPKVIPLGSRVWVETENGSYVYGAAIAADTGGAIKGNKIDLCFGSHQEALNFGRRTVKVYIE